MDDNKGRRIFDGPTVPQDNSVCAMLHPPRHEVQTETSSCIRCNTVLYPLTSSMAQEALPFMRWAMDAARLSWFGLRGLGVILLRGMIVTLLKDHHKHKTKGSTVE